MPLIHSDEDLKAALTSVHRIAVIGAKSDGGPAERIPAYLREHGYDVIPVNPKGGEVAGITAVTSLGEAGDVDAVVLFRRSEAIPTHMQEVLDAKPQLAWMQLGIQNEEAANAWSQAAISVVQDRCIMVEHRRLFA
ncbi:MAG: CoA-binding protein [bacterium]